MVMFDGDLIEILREAYAGDTGRVEFVAVVATLDIKAYDEFASNLNATKVFVYKLAERLQADDKKRHDAVIAFYKALPGSAKLRAWVARNLPAEDQALVSEAQFALERPAFEARISTSAMAEGLAQLNGRLDQPKIALLVEKSRGELAYARQQVRLVGLYKALHDKIHDVQKRPFTQFCEILLKPTLDQLDIDLVNRMSSDFRQPLEELGETIAEIQDEVPEFNGNWVGNIVDVFSYLSVSKALTWQQLFNLNMTLRTALSGPHDTLNNEMREAAGSIPFRKLAALLEQAEAVSKGGDAEQLRMAAAKAHAIDEALGKIIMTHDKWQVLDRLLWGFEYAYPVVADDPGMRDFTNRQWQQIVAALKPLIRNEPNQAEISAAVDEFNAALTADPPTKDRLGRAYFKLAKVLRDRFYQVDQTLLGQCKELQQLRRPLEDLKDA